MPKVTKHMSNQLVTVSYPVSEDVLDITQAEYNLILSLRADKVKAIKFLKDQYDLGLYQAKQAVDTILCTIVTN